MIDTELTMSAEATLEFSRMMTTVDMEAIRQRDEFISGIQLGQGEENGITIDCPEWNVDLSPLKNKIISESVNIYKNESSRYLNSIKLMRMNSSTEKMPLWLVNSSEQKEKNYVNREVNLMEQANVICYAA